jgi:aquaporin Z
MSTRPNLQPTLRAISHEAALPETPPLGAINSLRTHWPEYLIEASLLGLFMISACLFGVLYEFPLSPARKAIDSQLLRRLLMGISMGLTAAALTYSPLGKRSGAHYNPSVTLTFWRLGKIRSWDALFYVDFQFVGGAIGLVIVSAVLGPRLADPKVNFVTTLPGPSGPWVAFAAEFVIAFGLMTVVLIASNHTKLNKFTGLFAGLLVATYITIEAPLSGMSMNPARTLSSSFSGHVWTALWVYFTAPPLAMLAAAQVYLWRNGKDKVRCAKLHHNNSKRCIFCGANGGFAR